MNREKMSNDDNTKINVYFLRKKKKKDIALEFLKSACECYEKGKYFSALNLAGASEDILGKYLNAHGIEHALKSETEALIKVAKKFIIGKFLKSMLGIRY
jgi:hypothetical protein